MISILISRARLLTLLLMCGLAPQLRADGTVSTCSEEGLQQALVGGGRVGFTGSCSITVTAPIQIGVDTTIDAGTNTVTLSGGGAVRVFNVDAGVHLTLLGLTITGGASSNGGALYLSQDSTVLLTNCTLTGNAAVGSNGIAGATGSSSTYANGGNGGDGTSGLTGLGGAIYNLGDLTLAGCKLNGNSASGGQGGKGGNGGNGALNAGSGGEGGAGGDAAGGAVWNGGTLRNLGCTYTNNSATAGSGANGGNSGSGTFPGLAGSGGRGGNARGAAIFSDNEAMASGCTFADNTVHGGSSAAGGTQGNGNGSEGLPGGASLGGGAYLGGTGGATNCTFVSDEAIGGNGGNGGNGSFNAGNGGDGGQGAGGGVYGNGTAAVINCTFSVCSAIGGTNGIAGSGTFPGNKGNPGVGRGGAVAKGGGTLVLQNSILDASTSGENLSGAVLDAGHNLSSDTSGPLGASSQIAIDPKLGTLADNGGPTPTLLPSPDSPAINAADDQGAPDVDQRGLPRPGPGKPHTDIGAVEAQPPSITTQPLSQTAALGGTATFTAAVAGDLPLAYSWRFNGTNLPAATASQLVLANLTLTNAGQYDLALTNGFGGVLSAPATLSLNSGPALTLIPPAATAPASTSFGLVFAGESGVSYELQFKTSLDDTNWTPLGTNLGIGTLITNQVATTNSPSGFYRLLLR